MKPFLATALLVMLAMPALAADAKKMSTRSDEGITKAEEGFFAAWNRHDVPAMIAFWADDATLINPMGRAAHGRAEVEKLLDDEQTTVFKNTKVSVSDFTITRSLGSGVAFCDGELTVDGAVGPDGAALPQMKVHLAMLMQKQGARWVVADARPCVYPPPPGQPAGN